MREIKFRGRRKNSTEWVYGAFLAIPRLCSYIYDVQPDGHATRYLVDEDTVGQSTGLKDADEREIYEGDVIRSDLLPHMRTTVCNGCVEYRNGAFYVEYIDHTYANLGDLIFYSGTSSTVIGNIHDNPDLLEKQP